MIRREIDVMLVTAGMILNAIISTPHYVYYNRQLKKRSRQRQQFYKEMYKHGS
jgi:hypothetical protein